MHTLTALLLCLAGSGWLATALAARDLSVPPPMPADTPRRPHRPPAATGPQERPASIVA